MSMSFSADRVIILNFPITINVISKIHPISSLFVRNNQSVMALTSLPCRTKTRRRQSERKKRRRLWRRPCWQGRVVLGEVALWAGQGPAAGRPDAVAPERPAARAAPTAGGGLRPHPPSLMETVRQDSLNVLRQRGGELNSPAASLSVVQTPPAGELGGRRACMTQTGPPTVSSTSYFPLPTSCFCFHNGNYQC